MSDPWRLWLRGVIDWSELNRVSAAEVLDYLGAVVRGEVEPPQPVEPGTPLGGPPVEV